MLHVRNEEGSTWRRVLVNHPRHAFGGHYGNIMQF
jgi:hypothetical protein